ncbi:MAG: hypothetical protein ACE5IY_23265, partial [bacterium]
MDRAKITGRELISAISCTTSRMNVPGAPINTCGRGDVTPSIKGKLHMIVGIGPVVRCKVLSRFDHQPREVYETITCGVLLVHAIHKA